jgi:hypothetical protein
LHPDFVVGGITFVLGKPVASASVRYYDSSRLHRLGKSVYSLFAIIDSCGLRLCNAVVSDVRDARLS